MRAIVVILAFLLAALATAYGLVSQSSAGLNLFGSATSAASGDNWQASLPPLSVSPSRSAVAGQILTLAGGQRKPLAETPVLLGTVHWNAQKSDGAFIFEGASGPRAVTKTDGSFAVVDIAPGDYVILVGDLLGRYEIVSSPDGRAKVFTAPTGTPLIVGQVEVRGLP